MRAEIKLYNEDCFPAMKAMEDNQFDLSICDPPYGIMNKIISGGETNRRIKIQKGLEKFRDILPSAEYFEHLFRISKNQIIFGGNYFVKYLDHSRGWVVWDKKIPEGMSFAMCELIYTSFNVNAKIYRGTVGIKMIHPTEKPVKLYKWLLKNYAKEGDKIFDSHLGSGSIAIACWDMKFDLTAYEIDKEYYDAACKRFNEHTRQMQLF